MPRQGVSNSRRARPRGFTLLEIVVAIALSVLLLGVTLGFYHETLEARRHLRREIASVAQQRDAMDRLTDELRAALAYRFLGLGLEGSLSELRAVPTTRVPGASVWIERGATDDPLPPEHDITIVGYRLGIEEDEDGLPVIYGLERTEQLMITARVPEEGDQIKSRVIAADIRFLRFRYLANGEWLGSWTGGDLPVAVEITMGTEPVEIENEDDLLDYDLTEYPGQLYQRVVALPAGFQQQQRRTRGLGGG